MSSRSSTPDLPESPNGHESLAGEAGGHETASREVGRRRFLELAGLGGLAVGAAGALGGLDAPLAAAAGPTTTTAKRSVRGMPKTVKVGVIAPFDGLGAFVGAIVTRSLDSTMKHIKDAKLYPGIDVQLVKVNAKAEEQADGTTKAYQQLVADPDVIGILWCTPFGLKEAKTSIARDGIPVIAVYNDLWSEGLLYPKGPERSIFQMYLPDLKAMQQLLKYAKKDRGYTSAGLIYDTITPPATNTEKYFRLAAKQAGINVAGVETFNLLSADYGAQITRLKAAKPQCLLVWGLAENTAGVVKALDAIGAGYVDTPTAKGADWHPHVMGSPGGTGEKKWAGLAGDAAKVGSLTCWYLGGFVGAPDFPIRDWMHKYANTYPTGGEEVPANGLYALLEASRVSKGKDRTKMVDALEKFTGTFAALQYGWTPKRHLSLTDDQLALVTLEHAEYPGKTDPPYVGGKEKDLYLQIDPHYFGPTILVRPTRARNTKAYPSAMKTVLEQGYGVQCTKTPPDALGLKVKMTNACKLH
ncbi:MAG: ABC transporter substrate-binding protein [Acidimicrobiia bacterium]